MTWKKWLHFLWISRRFSEQPSRRASLDHFISILRDLSLLWEGLYHTETSPLIRRENQWSGFYMMKTFAIKDLNTCRSWDCEFIYNSFGLGHFWKCLKFVKCEYFFITVSGVANSTKSETVFSNEFGCPHEYLWCHDTPRIYLSQIIIGMVFLSIGYPFVMVVSTTLYSKILGPNPQVN